MTWADLLETDIGGDISGGVAVGAAVGAELSAAIGTLGKEIDELADDELGDAVVRVAELRSRLEAAEIALVGRFDRSTEWSRDGYRHPTAWIRTQCRLPKRTAGKRVSLSRKLGSMPHTAAAFADGLIDVAHLDRLARANSPARAEAFTIAEAALVASAVEDSFEDFCRNVDYFEAEVDPDPDGTEADRDGKRRAHSSTMYNGLGKVDAVLTPDGWSLFDTCLRRIEKELFDADWAAVIAEHGDAACLELMPRSARQRRADALVEMARRAAGNPLAAGSPKPLVLVHIDAGTLEAELKRRVGVDYEYPPDRTCELQDGTVISPGRAAELALEGHVRRMVFDPHGVCLQYGRKNRLYSGALKEMIEARDRHCQGPGCDIPHWDCDVDHVIDWQHHGNTDGDNGELKCRWHNQHKPHYTITKDPTTGRIRWRKRDP